DNQGHDGSGVHSQAGRGLRFYSQRVCDRVQAKGATTYNELSGGQPGEHVEDIVGQEPSGQENIRRRVYDALNVLEALGIISMDKKEIQWIGVEDSKVLNETTKKTGAASQSHHRRELDEESEEPEDDDMDIEQLQREVDALKLRNELERAQLQDQVSRHVQLDNLVARNKLRETREQERHERRKQKKLKREDRTRGADGDDSGCNPDNMEPVEEKKKKPERRRHRSPRHRPEEGGHGNEDEEEEEGGEDSHAHEGETKEERRARKEARRERRERKEKRAQRRLERESAAMLEEGEKIQMPFVVVRIPRYAGQSSDSEASISVVRRVREARPKKSKAKRQEETTM
ncbi:Transcription factor Dp-2, partial [Podila epicladia]